MIEYSFLESRPVFGCISAVISKSLIMLSKQDNLYSTQIHLREEQQRLLKALLQTDSAKSRKPSTAPGIDIKKPEKDMKASKHTGPLLQQQGRYLFFFFEKKMF